MFIRLYMIYLLFSNVSAGADESKILQLETFVIAQEGEYANLSCFHPNEQISKVLWYKQLIGQEPRLLASSYHHGLPFDFHNNFELAGRYNLSRAADSTNLTITRLEPSDAAVYYCAGSFSNVVLFGAGTILSLKGKYSSKYTVVQQKPLPELLRSEDSVTLQCSVLTKGCAGEASVYWFRHGSVESLPGIIYTHSDRNDECSKSSDTDSSARTCVYNLHKSNLSHSDAGTYYCAVAMCGEILFGQGTKVGIKDDSAKQLHVLIGLTVLLFISVIVNFVLCFICRKGNSSEDTVAADKDTGLRGQNQMTDEMNYAALSFSTKNTPGRKVRHHEETVYSGLACAKQT